MRFRYQLEKHGIDELQATEAQLNVNTKNAAEDISNFIWLISVEISH